MSLELTCTSRARQFLEQTGSSDWWYEQALSSIRRPDSASVGEVNARRLPVSASASKGMPVHAHAPRTSTYTHMHSYRTYNTCKRKKKEEIEALPEGKNVLRERAVPRASELRLSRARRCRAVNAAQVGGAFLGHTKPWVRPLPPLNQTCTSTIPGREAPEGSKVRVILSYK